MSAVEPSIFQKVYGPFDFTQGSLAVQFAGHDRIGERSLLAMTGSVSAVEPSSFQKVCGPFDFTQGSYAVAVAELVEVQGSLAVQMSAMTGPVSAVCWPR